MKHMSFEGLIKWLTNFWVRKWANKTCY